MQRQTKNRVFIVIAFMVGVSITAAFMVAIMAASPEYRIKQTCIDNGGNPQVVANIPQSPSRSSPYGTIECLFRD